MKKIFILTALFIFLIPYIVYADDVDQRDKRKQPIHTYFDQINAAYGDSDIELGGTAPSTLRYSCNNSKVVSVSQVGTVKILGVGKAEITLYAEATDEYKAAKKVIPVRIVKAVPEVKAYGNSVKIGGELDLKATTTSGTKLTYSTSDKRIAKVNKDGIVTGIEPGNVTITVKSKKNKNYKSGSTTVEIKVYN